MRNFFAGLFLLLSSRRAHRSSSHSRRARHSPSRSRRATDSRADIMLSSHRAHRSSSHSRRATDSRADTVPHRMHSRTMAEGHSEWETMVS